jgi:hypothetical protein
MAASKGIKQASKQERKGTPRNEKEHGVMGTIDRSMEDGLLLLHGRLLQSSFASVSTATLNF